MESRAGASISGFRLEQAGKQILYQRESITVRCSACRMNCEIFLSQRTARGTYSCVYHVPTTGVMIDGPAGGHSDPCKVVVYNPVSNVFRHICDVLPMVGDRRYQSGRFLELLNYALNPANEFVMEELFNAGFESGERWSFMVRFRY